MPSLALGALQTKNSTQQFVLYTSALPVYSVATELKVLTASHFLLETELKFTVSRFERLQTQRALRSRTGLLLFNSEQLAEGVRSHFE